MELIDYLSILIPQRKIEKKFAETEIRGSNIANIFSLKYRAKPRKVKNRMIGKSRIKLTKGKTIVFPSIGYNFRVTNLEPNGKECV